jgi:hypothetical protein
MPATHPDTALVPFMRGELSGAERERIAGHLEGCAQCRQEAESFQSLLAELSGRLDELPTPDWSIYRAQLRDKLAERLQPRTPWWQLSFGWAGLAMGAAAAAIALWLVVPGLRHGGSTQDQLALVQPQDQLALMQPMEVADVGLLRNYGVVERLDLLENYDVIEHLDEIKPAAPQPGNAARS